MAGEDDALFQKGMPIRREVLGPDYVDASMARADEVMMSFLRAPTACAWGIALAHALEDFRRRGFRSSRIEGRRRCVFDLQLDRLRQLRPGHLRDERQGEIDAGSDAAAGDNVAVADYATWIRHHAVVFQERTDSPMAGAALAIEKTGGGKNQRTIAHGCYVGRLCGQPE